MLFAFLVTAATCGFHDRELSMVMPRYRASVDVAILQLKGQICAGLLG